MLLYVLNNNRQIYIVIRRQLRGDYREDKYYKNILDVCTHTAGCVTFSLITLLYEQHF